MNKNWKMILFEYPESLLSDAGIVSLLAMIERFGLVTEEELQGYTKIDQPTIIKRLLTLHKNGMIEYNRSFIKITSRGKQLIDRFDLKDMILDEILKAMPAKTDTFDRLRQVFSTYRDNAFESYTESLSAGKIWMNMCAVLNPRATMLDEVIAGGFYAILLKDSLNWRAMAHVRTSVSEHPEMLLWDRLSEERELPKQMSPHKDIRIMDHINRFISIHSDIEDSKQYWNHVEAVEDFAGLWSVHQHTRARSEPTMWLEDWSHQGTWFRVIATCRTSRQALHETAKYGMQSWKPANEVNVDRAKTEIAMKKSFNPQFENLLFTILTSDKMSDLAATLNIDIEAARNMINVIRTKCNQLIVSDGIE